MGSLTRASKPHPPAYPRSGERQGRRSNQPRRDRASAEHESSARKVPEESGRDRAERARWDPNPQGWEEGGGGGGEVTSRGGRGREEEEEDGDACGGRETRRRSHVMRAKRGRQSKQRRRTTTRTTGWVGVGLRTGESGSRQGRHKCYNMF
ncbi:hypothetical protein DAI22_01g048200 [Oryza sativa Japonica Group]|nr:hypothetical protein DAI22_01g048200 [Oryza sativa Japonica Group]